MSRLILLIFTIFSAAAFAGKDTFTALPETMFNIDSYDPESKTYELTYLEYPAQGPLITTPEHLAKAIPTINLDRIQRSPTSIIDHQYQTDKTLILLMPAAIEARKKKFLADEKPAGKESKAKKK